MMELTIYHNGECSKSRGARELLQEQGIPHQVRWYMADPLTADEIRVLLAMLGCTANELIRKNEAAYQQYVGAIHTEEEWITIMAENPVLIERPVAACGGRAVIARPPERIFELPCVVQPEHAG